MASSCEPREPLSRYESTPSLAPCLFIVLSAIVLAYALLAGLRTVTDFDLGWQMATGRWIVQHYQIPSTDVFSYTAPGQPWIYPVGSALLLYAVFALGGWALLSWLGAAVCTGTVALLLRRGSLVTAALAVIAIPRIALHTTPRADMFTVLIFAAFLSLLWQQRQSGDARLWLLPLLMTAWVNLHLGFVAGFALLAAYLATEILDLPWPERRAATMERLRRASPWLLATLPATLLNPWGWGIYKALFRQNAAMAQHSQQIIEWASVQLSWTLVAGGFSLRGTGGAFYSMLLLAAIAVLVALLQRQLGAALLVSGAAWLSARHIRFQALFAVVLVIVGGAVLTPALHALKQRITDPRFRSAVALGATALAVALAAVRCSDLATDQAYLGTTDLGSFGVGLSWWFPEGAARFLERENIPGQIFNSYNEGGYLVWRVGQKYQDYIDGRAIPFGSELFQKNGQLLGTPPGSAAWQSEAERYGINAIVVPLARYDALQFFPVLRQFCADAVWRPVYLDEVSAVFLRQTPRNEALIRRLQIDCGTAPVLAPPPSGHDSKSFNRWANAAALLQALGRNSEAFDATTQAVAIFPGSAFVRFLRGNLLRDAGNGREAEREYRAAASLEGNAATWSALADLYRGEGRLALEIQAREQAVEFLPHPGLALLSLGYSYLDSRRPADALRAFDRAQTSLPGDQPDSAFLANLAHGRAAAYMALGNLDRAIGFEEETVRLTPTRADDWLLLADLYGHRGRLADAERARQQAEGLKIRDASTRAEEGR